MSQFDQQWVISASTAKQLIAQATVLDVRNSIAWFLGHIPGAIHVNWQQFSQQKSPDQGKLIENSDVLEKKLRNLGIFINKPVIVVGNSGNNFGEEGRIVWMLRTLGHSRAAFVDGGYTALLQAGVAVERVSQAREIGDFIVKRSPLWEIDCKQLKTQLADKNVIVIDTRKPCEYAGATPYKEQRGGHIPGAINFYFKKLMDSQEYLLPKHEIIAQLNQLKIERDTPIIAYCTGGIRSAFFVAVLANIGFSNVKNYAGSMWEWSAAPAINYPLIKAINK